MKKVLLLSMFFSLLIFSANECYGEGVSTSLDNSNEAKLQLEVSKNAEEEKIKALINNIIDIQNKHNTFLLKNYYTEDYVNTDGFNRKQLFSLMKKTYENFPDLKTDCRTEKIIVSQNYAMVYMKHSVSATTKDISKITGDKGNYEAELDVIWYLKKTNKDWQIYSEKVAYESSKLSYGSAKNITASVNSPNVVFAGSDYCVGVNVDIPAEFTAMVSVNNTQVVEGFNLTGENFRPLNADKNKLERILKANVDSNNEAVVISVGLTQTGQDLFKKPRIDISGLIMLMKRVDVIPKNSNTALQKDSNATE